MLSGEKFNLITTNMSAMELKNRGDRKKMMSHVRNLVALAYADGKFSDEERQYVANVATEVGMTADEASCATTAHATPASKAAVTKLLPKGSHNRERRWFKPCIKIL